MTDTARPEPIFSEGLMFQKPREGAPEHVKGNLSVNIVRFMEFVRDMRAKGHISAKGWLNLDLKKSKTGALYFQVNLWKSPETKSVEAIKEETRSMLTPEESQSVNAHREAHNRASEDWTELAEQIPF